MNAILLPHAKNNLWRRMKAWLIAASLYIKHLQWKARLYYERMAGEFLHIAKRGIAGFVENADKIYSAGTWKPKAKSWDAYCLATWGFGASHLSHLRGAAPYARVILESGHNIPILEGWIRKMRKYVPKESPLIAETYVLGAKVAAQLGQSPSDGIYRRAFEVLETVDRTGGTFQIGDKTVFIRDEASAIQAVVDVLGEVKRLGIDSNPVQKTKVNVTARREGDFWVIEAEQDLPDIIRFSVFV